MSLSMWNLGPKKPIGRIIWHGISLCAVRSVCRAIGICLHAFLTCSACCDTSSSRCFYILRHERMLLRSVKTHEASKCQGIPPSLGSSGFSGHLPLVQWGGKSTQLNHKPFIELLWRQSWALLQGLLSTQKSNGQYGQVSVSMEHAHPRENALHWQRVPQFYFLEDFPGFLLNIGGFKYIYF